MLISTAGLERDDPFSDSRRLWSLWDMLKVSAKECIELGSRTEETRRMFVEREESELSDPVEDENLRRHENEDLRQGLIKIFDECVKLHLPISGDLISSRMEKLPKTLGDFDVLIDAQNTELK